MSGISKRLQLAVWGGLALVIALIIALFVQDGGFRRKRAAYPIISVVEPFVLTNQFGKATSLGDLKGSVWVADVIFTRCGGPCPEMTRVMAELQKKTPDSVRLVTITTDPEFDTPAVMKRYSEKFDANPQSWSFLTGPQAVIKQVAVDGLKFTAIPKGEGEQASDNDLFIHSTTFVVVDKRGRMRASVEALEPFALDTLTKIVSDLEMEPNR